MIKHAATFVITLVIILLSATCSFAGEQTHEKNPLVKIPTIKKQFFCGYCHVLTYPRIIKKAHASWKRGKHQDVNCAECHYPPEASKEKIPEHKNIPKDEAAAKKKKTAMEYITTEMEVLSLLTTVLSMEDSVVRTKPRVDDRNCVTSQCHGSQKDDFMTKKIKFTKKAFFVHKTHYDKEKWIEGQETHCTTCHQQETRGKHFEVSKEKCFLCHFKNAEFNKEKSKCSLCHEIPSKSLQAQKTDDASDENAITHKSLEKANVPCESCHYQLVKGKGNVKKEHCLNCHDNEKSITNEVLNMGVMHEKHVADQNAHCFSCHEPILHEENDFMETARKECSSCHPDHHQYQIMLLAGNKRKDVSKTPSLMAGVKTNCFGCHTNEKYFQGEKVLHGSGKTCAACHTKKHEKMANEWKKEIEEELKYAKTLEKEANEVIKALKDKVTKEKLKEAMKMVKAGRYNMIIVKYGGGVHNKKYSIMLLDVAMNNFEDAIDLLQEE